MAEVQLTGVEKRFDGVRVLESLDLVVADGEFVVLLGPSGCGKTTALRIIAGLEPPTAGRVLIGGRDVTNLSPRERDVAMVFQSYALYPHMSIEDNIGYPLRIRRVPARGRASCPVGSASGSHWPGRSSGTRLPSSWTSHCRTWTQSCGSACAARSGGCSSGWAQRRST